MTGYVVWCAVVAVGTSAMVCGAALLLRRSRIGERRERWHDQTTGPAGAMFNALFLAAFGLAAVTALQGYDHAKTHTEDEGTALVALYDDVGPLPGADALRAEIRSYASILIDKEWPLLPAGGSADAADAALRDLSARVLAVQPPDSAVQAARTEVVKALDNAIAARQQRLRDAESGAPTALLICLVITAAVVLGHALIVGLPHSTSSLIPLLTEAALIAAAVFVVFLIRRPYHGALNIGPDQIRLVLARFTARG